MFFLVLACVEMVVSKVLPMTSISLPSILPTYIPMIWVGRFLHFVKNKRSSHKQTAKSNFKWPVRWWEIFTFCKILREAHTNELSRASSSGQSDMFYNFQEMFLSLNPLKLSWTWIRLLVQLLILFGQLQSLLISFTYLTYQFLTLYVFRRHSLVIHDSEYRTCAWCSTYIFFHL